MYRLRVEVECKVKAISSLICSVCASHHLSLSLSLFFSLTSFGMFSLSLWLCAVACSREFFKAAAEIARYGIGWALRETVNRQTSQQLEEQRRKRWKRKAIAHYGRNRQRRVNEIKRKKRSVKSSLRVHVLGSLPLMYLLPCAFPLILLACSGTRPSFLFALPSLLYPPISFSSSCASSDAPAVWM